MTIYLHWLVPVALVQYWALPLDPHTLVERWWVVSGVYQSSSDSPPDSCCAPPLFCPSPTGPRTRTRMYLLIMSAYRSLGKPLRVPSTCMYGIYNKIFCRLISTMHNYKKCRGQAKARCCYRHLADGCLVGQSDLHLLCNLSLLSLTKQQLPSLHLSYQLVPLTLQQSYSALEVGLNLE